MVAHAATLIPAPASKFGLGDRRGHIADLTWHACQWQALTRRRAYDLWYWSRAAGP
jgi:hypothetical protein